MPTTRAQITLVVRPKREEELKKILEANRRPFEHKRLEKFANLLGIPNAVTSYEYLQNGERDGIQQWKQFVHIPDLTAKRAAAKAAKAQIKAEWKRLLKEGPLVVDQEGCKVGSGDFFASPVWCFDPFRNDILLAWTGNPDGETKSTPVERVDPQTGARTAAKLHIPDKARCFAVSPNGRSLAIGCASGDWKTQIWDIESGLLSFEFDQKRLVEQVCFGANGNTLISLSENIVTVLNLKALNRIDHIELAEHVQRFAIHPSGTHLALRCGGKISVVELDSRKLITTAWIPEPPGPRLDMIERWRAQTGRDTVPKQSVLSVNFDQSGRHLYCGTTAGVCKLDWARLLTIPAGDSVVPVSFVRAAPREDDIEGLDGQIVYSIPLDHTTNRILFAGLEGIVSFANIDDGRTGPLVVPPVRMPFWKLELSPNRKFLMGTAVPRPCNAKKHEASHFQIWDYRALCEAVGLTW